MSLRKRLLADSGITQKDKVAACPQKIVSNFMSNSVKIVVEVRVEQFHPQIPFEFPLISFVKNILTETLPKPLQSPCINWFSKWINAKDDSK